MASSVPRWGALTFDEKVENDMVVNRVKDIHAKPHKTNYLKRNMLNTSASFSKSLVKSSPLDLQEDSTPQVDKGEEKKKKLDNER